MKLTLQLARNRAVGPERRSAILGMKPQELTVDSAIAGFGAKTKQKLANPGASGQPEDQLRAPFEQLLADIAAICHFPTGAVTAVGESSQKQIKTRPDYSVTVHKTLVGFVELKAPGKGADPRKFKDPHDREQWEKLQSLPNLIYSDGNSFSLWQNGVLVDPVLTLIGDVESSGSKLKAPPGLGILFETFLRWDPIPPRSAKDLAHTTARLCRLLRDEVTEQLTLKSEALTGLAADWRKLLFPDATDARFADGYAQAVTFGMLMARQENRAQRRASSCCRRLVQNQHADWRGTQAPYRQCRDTGNFEDGARNANSRPRCCGLGQNQQRRSRCLALLLRRLPVGVRQQLAQADRLVLHTA